MPLRIGEMFAGYRILRLLGSGGMGEVYLVQHPRLPRHDALKVLRPDVSSDASFQERFIREADMAASLWHPHIVGVHDRGEYEGQLWIAMDYVDGLDAAHLLERRYPAGMPVVDVVDIVHAVASALDYAHKRGLIHRDVKPANVMLADLDEDERRVLLTDFGIARAIDDTSGLTTTNMTVGTVAYAAPEQLMGEDIDGRADQYALAATTYYLLTGRHLYPHTNPAVVISKHLNATPPELADLNPQLAPLDPVLAAGLAKSPEGRFRCCADFGKALAEHVSTSASKSALAPTTPAPLAPRRTAPHQSAQPSPPAPVFRAEHLSRRWMIGAGVAAVLVVGTILAIIWPRHEGPVDATDPTPSPVPTSATTTSKPPPPTFSATAITPASPAPASAQPTLPDADAQGFLNYPGARCNYNNPAVAIARTEQSLVVICQTGVGRFYYRGLGLQNGLSVEIDDPVRTGTGFVATNNGVQYSLSRDALTISQGSVALSNEPVLEFWSD